MGYGQTASLLWGPALLQLRGSSSHSSSTTSPSSNDAGVDAAGRSRGGGADELEVSVHTLPKPLQREFGHVFDERNLPLESIADRDNAEFLAIPTNQRAQEDLVAVGAHIEEEKDRLLNAFMDFARDFCERIRTAGYWSDYIDPASGLPMLTANCNKVYSEVDGMECCLGYKSYNAGFCKILTHPQWGSAVYPATMFVFAPRQLVLDILQEYRVTKS